MFELTADGIELIEIAPGIDQLVIESGWRRDELHALFLELVRSNFLRKS